MYAPRGVQWTGTNRPRTCPTRHHCPHKAPQVNHGKTQAKSVLASTHCTPPHHTTLDLWWGWFGVPVATAEGKRPDPSRTRKLSPPAPMVLRPTGRGRVGHRRNTQPPPPTPSPRRPPGPGGFVLPPPRMIGTPGIGPIGPLRRPNRHRGVGLSTGMSAPFPFPLPIGAPCPQTAPSGSRSGGGRR